MSLLRTKRLAVHHTPVRVGFESIYTVPAGKRAVIRDLRLAAQGPAGTTSTLVMARASGGSGDLYLLTHTFGANETQSAQGDVVLEQGDELLFNAGGDNMTIWVSGAELDLNPSP